MRNLCSNILSAVDTSSQTGSAIDTGQTVSASFMIYFGDASANGTFKIQASDDPTASGGVPGNPSPSHWVDIPNATATITSGGSAIITIANMSYRWIRAVYTRSSGGSSTLNVNINSLSL